METASDAVGEQDAVNCEYAGQVLGAMSEIDNLRDITLVAGIDKQKYSVHRLVMMSASKYFRALLGPNFKEGQAKEVPVTDIDGPTLKAIIDFCYSGNIKITSDNVVQVVAAASAMELVLIEKKCEQFWGDNLATTNCVKTLLWADKYSFADLRRRLLEFMCKNFKAVADKQVLDLGYQHFIEILECDEIYALEDDIFECLVQWIGYDHENRSKSAPDLFRLIQLGKITQPTLLSSVEPFAKKYNFLDRVIDEYHKRFQSDDNTFDPCRHSVNPRGSIFVATYQDNIICIDKYNPISNRWISSDILNVEGLKDRTHFGLILAENKIIIIWQTLCIYNLHPFQKMNEIRLTTCRVGAEPILLNNSIYLFGGYTATSMQSCECFSLDSMTTRTLQPMIFGRFIYSAAVMNGKIYVAGGTNELRSTSSSVECYDPVVDTWTELANMNHPRKVFGLVEQSGMLYALGAHESIEKYDPLLNVWTVVASDDEYKHIVRAVNVHDRTYVLLKGGQLALLKPDSNEKMQKLRSVHSSTRKMVYYCNFLLTQ